MLDATGFTQPALYALEVSLAALWGSWGIHPTVVSGTASASSPPHARPASSAWKTALTSLPRAATSCSRYRPAAS